MRESQIIASILYGRSRRTFCLPRYTPLRWFENDVLEITPHDYWVEYEVKVSVADFKADRLKKRCMNPRWMYGPDKLVVGRKHDLMEDPTKGPNRFVFVVPEGMIDESDVPHWAGLWWVKPPGHLGVGSIKVMRRPKLRHTRKVSEDLKTHTKSVLYYRLMEKYIREGTIKKKEDHEQ